MAKHIPFKVTALTSAILAASALTPAYGFEYSDGEFKMQLNTTVSAGASWRAEDVDYKQIGLQNALAAEAAGDNRDGDVHLHGSSAADDSDLLWKKNSTFSELAKISMDLDLNYADQYGAFIRGKAFYDQRIVKGDGVTDLPAYYWQDDMGRNQLPRQSAGRSADIQDAFVWANWDIGGSPLNVRVGKQVISWGEGLLFANGINSINPLDINALLAPGSEVKDALIPLNSVFASYGVTDALTVEGFVLLEWRETELPACGTFFSQTDLVGSGCWAGFVPSGYESSHPAAATVTLPRAEDGEPDDNSQFGFALRYMVDSIETEFGLYYTHLNSTLPVISGHTPDVSQLGFTTLEQARSVLVAGGGTPLATVALLPYADYFAEYTEGVELLGVSFSTTMGLGLPGGDTAVSGEISMRKNQAFAREDGDALAGAVGLPSLSCYDAPRQYDCYSKFEPGQYNPGYVTTDYFQAELAFVQFFDQVLWADRWTAILDIGGSYLDMPSKKDTILNSAYNATLNFPGLPRADWTVPGHPLFGALPYTSFVGIAEAQSLTYARQEHNYPTSGAWGYKMRFSGDYNNVFAGVNLRPTISFSHDVYGTTPSPIANFLEDRKAVGLSLDAIYLNNYTVTVAYNTFFGAKPYNSMADRDYYTVSASAAF